MFLCDTRAFSYLLSCRLRNAALRPPASCSSPPGPITPLQTTSSLKERPVRRRKEKADDDQLIIVRSSFIFLFARVHISLLLLDLLSCCVCVNCFFFGVVPIRMQDKSSLARRPAAHVGWFTARTTQKTISSTRSSTSASSTPSNLW